MLFPLRVLPLSVRVPLVRDRIAPPRPARPFAIVSPPISVSPEIAKSPVAAVILKIREFCWASIVSKLCPGPVRISDSVIDISPRESSIDCGVANSVESNVIISVPTLPFAAVIASRRLTSPVL